MNETLERTLARLITECDKDFRPVWSMDQWAFARADHIIERLEHLGFEIVKIEPSVNQEKEET